MHDDLIEKTKGLYAAMQAGYDAVAGSCGFSCEGCKDNCCVQRFFHHTHIEYLLLKEGMKQADEELRERIFSRANMVVNSYMHEIEAGELMPIMCPVNEGGLCTLYEWRPMICRLHGLPYKSPKRDGTELLGDGCARFYVQHPDVELRLDRSMFYPQMAQLELEYRMRTNDSSKYVKTTAEMIMDMSGDFAAPEED